MPIENERRRAQRVAQEKGQIRNDWYAILRQVKLFVVVVMVVMPATSLS